MRVVVVDAANVMGARPDGWWRDRAGAAQRLHDELASIDQPADEIVLVVEGKARGGPAAGRHGRIHTVHAGGSGDDTVVDEVLRQVAIGDGRRVVAVTADRALRARVMAAGAECESPRWLLGQTRGRTGRPRP